MILALQELVDDAIQERRVLGLRIGRRLMALHGRDFHESGTGNPGSGVAGGFGGIEQVERRGKDQRPRFDRGERGRRVAVEARRGSYVMRLIRPRLIKVVVRVESIRAVLRMDFFEQPLRTKRR